MAKYTALMMVALLALAGANASRELKGPLDGIVGGVVGSGGLLGGITGGGSGSQTGGNGGQGTSGNSIGNNGGQENNGNAQQTQVCQNSCNGGISVGCCTTIGNILNNNNVKLLELCNGNVDQCCVVPVQDAVDAAVGVLGAGLNVENLVSDLAAALAIFGSNVDNGNIKRCQ